MLLHSRNICTGAAAVLPSSCTLTEAASITGAQCRPARYPYAAEAPSCLLQHPLHAPPHPLANLCPTLLPCRALFSADQSFPLAAAFIYSVYQFQQKRIKRDPEGPFFLGNPMAGAVITTVINCALACAVSGSASCSADDVMWSVHL
jgi:hypothetical protein